MIRSTRYLKHSSAHSLPVPVVDTDLTIVDTANLGVGSATIDLIDPQGGDVLLVNGSAGASGRG